MPKVSIVIPLYNKGPHVARTINSVLNQTFQDFEVIVIDGGSTDNGAAIVMGFNDPRIQLYPQEKTGVSEARNQGIRIARADLIAFLDADDEWMPLHLETLLRLRIRYPQAGIYTTSYKVHKSDGSIRWANYKYIPNPPWEGLIPNYFKSAALGDSPVWTSSVAIPNTILAEVGAFSPGCWIQEDADLFGRIALKYPIAFSWEPGFIYHQNATNRVCNKLLPINNEIPFVKIAETAIQKGGVLPEMIEPLHEYICKVEIGRAIHNVYAGNTKIARQILRRLDTKWDRRMKAEWSILAMLPHPLFRFLQNIKKICCGII